MLFSRCLALHVLVSLRIAAVAAENAASCPPKEYPKLLYNHIEKTGGTAMHYLLKDVVKATKYTIEDPWLKSAASQGIIGKKRLEPADKEQNFVLGLVRRPCDHLLSWYTQTRSNDKLGNLTAKEFVMNVLENPEEFGVTTMSKAIVDHYGDGDNVHCMMRTHNLKADFIACMKKFQACGGQFKHFNNEQLFIPDVVDAALKESANDVSQKFGRSVGSHEPCSAVFDQEMLDKVLRTEQSIINKYDLGTCCSSDARMIQLPAPYDAPVLASGQ